MTFEVGSAITQIILSLGAVIVGVLATLVALTNARKQREADHQRWVNEKMVSAYADFNRVFLEMQSHKRRKRKIDPDGLKDWQSATAALELFGSIPVRLQVDEVWEKADSIRDVAHDTRAWEDLMIEIERLRELMRSDLGITSKSETKHTG